MATEFFAEAGKNVAITLTPGDSGVLQVIVDGEKIFDKMEEGGIHVDLPRLKQMRAHVREKMAATAAAD
jgi:predicted Rdx family selenoprotein